MPSANRTAFILDTVRGTLDNETTFDVVKVWRDGHYASNPIVYPYVMSTNVTEVQENGTLEHGITIVGVFVNASAQADTSKAGNATDKYADIMAKAAATIDAVTLPVAETHTDGKKTRIYSMVMNYQGGFFDIADNKIATDFQLTIHWLHYT